MKFFCIKILLTICLVSTLYAQDGISVSGGLMIHNNLNGQGLVVSKHYAINNLMHTQYTTNPNKVIFEENSSWSQKNENSFVDGFVRTHKKGRFLFPVGNKGTYKPLGLENAINAVVSYQKSTPMNATWVDSVRIDVISPVEFWDVSSVNNSKITIPYDAALSGLKAIDSDAINRLTIVAFDGYQWIKIPSAIDEFRLDQSNYKFISSKEYSGVIKGSISSTVTVPLIYFSSFTLALTNKSYKKGLPKRKLVQKSIDLVAEKQPDKATIIKDKVVSKPNVAVKKDQPKVVAQVDTLVTKKSNIVEKVRVETVQENSVQENSEPENSEPEKIHLSENRNKDYKFLTKIHFAFNEKDLSKYSTNILLRVVRDLQKLKGNYRLKLVGHTDMFGSSSYNYTLGLRRAETIRQFLQKNGITNVSVEIISEGEKEAKVDCTNCKASEMVSKRRVDVYIIQQKNKK